MAIEQAHGAFCAFCDHYISWHGEFNANSTSRKCNGSLKEVCTCRKFCVEFFPKEGDGVSCVNCDRDYFEHVSVKKTIQHRLLVPDPLEAAIQDDTAYRVAPVGLRLCCHWTLYHFMRRAEKHHLKLGLAIQCVNCKSTGVMTLTEFDDDVPLWKWSYRSGHSVASAIESGISQR